MRIYFDVDTQVSRPNSNTVVTPGMQDSSVIVNDYITDDECCCGAASTQNMRSFSLFNSVMLHMLMYLSYDMLCTPPPSHLPLLCHQQPILLHPLPYSTPQVKLTNKLQVMHSPCNSNRCIMKLLALRMELGKKMHKMM
jgi:hypothetical protein